VKYQLPTKQTTHPQLSRSRRDGSTHCQYVSILHGSQCRIPPLQKDKIFTHELQTTKSKMGDLDTNHQRKLELSKLFQDTKLKVADMTLYSKLHIR
jgi:hypothetical protein